MDFFIALLPILVLITLIVGFKRSVIFSAGGALIVLILASLWWGTTTLNLLASSLRGLFIASEIILIVFSALLIVDVIKRQDLFKPIQHMFAMISHDYRIQAMIIAFGLVYFIEGAAGFGTPAIVAVPFLVALGFRPLHAVVLSLVGDTIPVSFGAIGLPITFGIDSVIRSLSPDHVAITSGVIQQVALLNILASIILALVITAVAVRLKRGPLHAFTQFIPFAVVSGFIVSLAAFATAILIGPELPSIIGGLVGVFLISMMARHKILVPKRIHTHEDAELSAKHPIATYYHRRHIWRAIYPYLLLIGLLILSRLPYLPFRDWLQQTELSIDSIFGTEISYAIAPFYSAATILLLCALIVLFLARKHLHKPSQTISDVATMVKRPFVALTLVLVFVQIFIFSGTGGEVSMPMAIADTISRLSGSFWPFLVPFVGALGSFLAGSATVSNLIFSSLQYDIALNLGLDPVKLLSLQTIGAATGNMVALHNIVAALTIAGLSEGYSHRVVRINFIPLVIILTAVGIIGLFIT
jgi:lactate permease